METKETIDLPMIDNRIQKLQGLCQSLVDSLGNVCPRCGQPTGGSRCDTCG